jgi:hypothetical protein
VMFSYGESLAIKKAKFHCRCVLWLMASTQRQMSGRFIPP